MRKTERARGRTNGGDRDTGSVTNHDGRRIGRMSRTDRREYTRVRSSVVGSPRVSDPLSVRWWSQPHGAEGLRQRGLVPPPRPMRSVAWLRRGGPGRRGHGSGSSEHGRGLVLCTGPRPHGDAPRPRVGEGRPGRSSRSGGGRSRRRTVASPTGATTAASPTATVTAPTTTTTGATTAPSSTARPGRSTEEAGSGCSG